MAVPPPSPEKSLLRRQLRAARARFVQALEQRGVRAESEAAAVARLREHVPAGATLALFRVIGDELSPGSLLQTIDRSDHIVALPHVAADRSGIRFLRWQPGDPLERGSLGIEQPIATAEPVTPQCIVTPLVGFDRAGGRLGQGAAYYDRAFATLPDAYRVGLAWSVQEHSRLPRDPWDVPLHAVATEQEWISCPAGPA